MDLIHLFIDVANDAFYEIIIYIFISFLLFSVLESKFNRFVLNITSKVKHFQPIIGSIIGVIPGCGGLAVMMPLYHRRSVSFSAVIAALITTTGDVAFILIAKDIHLFLRVIAVTFPLGILSGYIVEWLHIEERFHLSFTQKQENTHNIVNKPKISFLFYLIMSIGIIGYILPEGNSKTYIAVFSILFLIIFRIFFYHEDPDTFICNNLYDTLYKTSLQIAHITTWIIGTFVAYEIIFTYFISEDQLMSLLSQNGLLIILVSVIIGAIPGCGVQIFYTSLYIIGAIPYVGLLTNMISQDGDGLVPLLAYEKKSALAATIITTSIALIFGLLYYFII